MEQLNKQVKEELVGRIIARCGNDYIELDNGTRIYLEQSEIEHLNENAQ